MERANMKRIVLVVRLLAGCTALTLSSVTLAQEQPSPTVTTLTTSVQEFTIKSRLPGRIKAETTAEVRPQVTGILKERLFEEGSPVKEGDSLYKIDDVTYTAAVASARAAVAQAQAGYDLAVAEARRAEDLFATKTGSAANRDNKVAERNRSEAALQVAQAQLTTAEIDLDRTTIRAPISGVIGFSQTTPGALVAAQQATPLTTIRSLDRVDVDVTQSVNDLLQWNERDRIGKTPAGVATLVLPDGANYPVKGDLKAAEPRVEPTTGMVTLRVSFANPEHLLLPGLYVEVELPQEHIEDAILLPQDVVMRDTKGAASVFLVENDKVTVRPVNVAASSGNLWVIDEGLKAGEVVITSGFQKIAPGAAVIIDNQPAPDKAAALRSN